jgi:hypothetical protein
MITNEDSANYASQQFFLHLQTYLKFLPKFIKDWLKIYNNSPNYFFEVCFNQVFKFLHWIRIYLNPRSDENFQLFLNIISEIQDQICSIILREEQLLNSVSSFENSTFVSNDDFQVFEEFFSYAGVSFPKIELDQQFPKDFAIFLLIHKKIKHQILNLIKKFKILIESQALNKF